MGLIRPETLWIRGLCITLVTLSSLNPISGWVHRRIFPANAPDVIDPRELAIDLLLAIPVAVLVTIVVKAIWRGWTKLMPPP